MNPTMVASDTDLKSQNQCVLDTSATALALVHIGFDRRRTPKFEMQLQRLVNEVCMRTVQAYFIDTPNTYPCNKEIQDVAVRMLTIECFYDFLLEYESIWNRHAHQQFLKQSEEQPDDPELAGKWLKEQIWNFLDTYMSTIPGSTRRQQSKHCRSAPASHLSTLEQFIHRSDHEYFEVTKFGRIHIANERRRQNIEALTKARFGEANVHNGFLPSDDTEEKYYAGFMKDKLSIGDGSWTFYREKYGWSGNEYLDLCLKKIQLLRKFRVNTILDTTFPKQGNIIVCGEYRNRCTEKFASFLYHHAPINRRRIKIRNEYTLLSKEDE